MVTFYVLPSKTAPLLKLSTPIAISSRLIRPRKHQLHRFPGLSVDNPFTPDREIALWNPRRIKDIRTPHLPTHSESYTCKCLGGIALTANSIRTIPATSRASRPARAPTRLPEARSSREKPPASAHVADDLSYRRRRPALQGCRAGSERSLKSVRSGLGLPKPNLEKLR